MVLDIYEKLDLDHFTSVILIDRINSRKDVLNSPWMISATKKLDTIRINDDIANVDLKVHLKNENRSKSGKVDLSGCCDHICIYIYIYRLVLRHEETYQSARSRQHRSRIVEKQIDFFC